MDNQKEIVRKQQETFIRNAAAKIRRALKVAGIEDKSLEPQIEIAAGAYVMYVKVRAAVLSLDEFVKVEPRRGGGSIAKPDPLLKLYYDYSTQYQTALDKLLLNVKGRTKEHGKIGPEESDGVSEFLRTMQRLDTRDED